MSTNALQFGGSGARVECGSASDIDDLPAGAFSMSLWLYYGGSGSVNIWHKGGSTTGWVVDAPGNDWRATLFRATTNAQLYSYNNNPLVTGGWVFCAMVWDPGDINNCKLYFGDETTNAVEVASYSGKTVGAGAYSSDAGGELRVGVNASNSSGNLRIAYPSLYSGVRTLPELVIQQFAPQVVASTIRLYDLGAGGVATAPDLSTAAADGTLAGTALPTWVAGPANVTAPGASPPSATPVSRGVFL